MGYFARLWRAKQLVKSAPIGTAGMRPADSAITSWFGAPSASGKVVTEDAAMRVSAAWACMRILAESVGGIPWALYKRDAEGNAQRADDHELSELLVRSPNAHQTSIEFREALMLSLCQAGNSYCWTERSGKRIVALTPMAARDVRPMRKLGANTTLQLAEGEVFYRVQDRGRPVDVPRERVWHVKLFSQDGLMGLSPLAAAREAMGSSLAAEEFGARFFSQGGAPAGVVTMPGWLTPEQREVARTNLAALVGGLGRAHQFALFEGGVKPEPWEGMSFEDLQFITSRKFSVLEICRFYRVPPHMVGDLDRATFSNIEHQSLEFVQFTLMPYFTRFEASISKWLLAPEDQGKFFMRFNPEALLRGDSESRAKFYNAALQNGWMNRNEVRAKENLNRVDGLDEYTVQTNMAPLDQLALLLQGKGGTKAQQDPDAATQLVQALERLANVRRRITVDGQEFVSEPINSARLVPAKH